jgi:hypothetical protein
MSAVVGGPNRKADKGLVMARSFPHHPDHRGEGKR